MTFSDPAEDKKCALSIVFIEQIQNALSVSFDAALVPVPIFKPDHGFEGRNVVVVFDVDS